MEQENIIFGMIRSAVASGSSIEDALSYVRVDGETRRRLKALAESELGIEISVGSGLVEDGVKPWVQKRNLDMFHWNRLRSLWVTDGKLRVGAIRTLDKTSLTILDNMPPPETDTFDWRGMVVGNVQSGKTACFTALIAKAADVGYKLFIVLSGRLKSLRLQTQLRISREVLGTPGLDSKSMPSGKQWHPLTNDRMEGDYTEPGGMGADLLQPGQTPTIAVIKKNIAVMDQLNTWLESIQLERPDIIRCLPVLVIDDESDEASIDTRVDPPSSTNRELRRLLGIFRRRAYLGFTATPYANCFIPHEKDHPDWGEDLYPRSFILPLETSSVYTGSERIFGRKGVWEEPDVAPIPGLYREVPSSELASLVPKDRSSKDSFQPTMTASLRKAVLSYLIAGAVRRVRQEADSPCTMLVHVSQYTAQHFKQKLLIEELLDDIYGVLIAGNGKASFRREVEDLWEDSFKPTTRAIAFDRAVEFSDVWEELQHFLELGKDVLVVNSESDDVIDFVRNPGLKAIVIGGQNLGRGLTLEGLVTTFFLRTAGNQSTAMQMQRWCGYRHSYLDLVRVYTTRDIREYYREFLSIEREMRDELKKYEREKLSPSEVGMRLRQHPDIPLVSRPKRGAQRPVSGDYAGKLPQTTVFAMEDHSQLLRNVEATREFVGRMNARGIRCESDNGQRVWKNVAVDLVLSYLTKYEYPSHGGRTSFHGGHICRYIKEENSHSRHLLDWTVAICGRKTDRHGAIDLGLEIPVNRRLRSLADEEKNPNRIGIITDPVDEAIGLDTNKRGSEARKERPPESGLLLIYPLAHPRSSSETVIGLAVSFSGNLRPRRSEEFAGSVLTEAEQIG